VKRSLIVTAMADLAAEARARRTIEPAGDARGEPGGVLSEPAYARPGVSEALLEQTEALGRVFAKGGFSVERFATESDSLLLAIIDADPSVRAVQARIEHARRWGRLEEVLSGRQDLDAVYAERHEAMAQVVRRHIGAHDITAALRGDTTHPYR